MKASNEKYNEKRKDLLSRLDKGNPVSNIELSMYDLTPYVEYKRDVMEITDISKQNENQSTIIEEDDWLSLSLSQIIIFNRKEKEPIEHIKNQEVYFVPKQQEVMMNILEHDKIIISAPTSFGKTLILKEYIYRFQPKVVVFIVPTNALAYELENTFKHNDSFSNYEVFDKTKDNSNKTIGNVLFIGTQEKYLEIRENFSQKIDLFIIDEAYKLGDKINAQRGYKLSETFLDSISTMSKKLVLLSPNAKFEGFEKFNFYFVDTKFNVVDKDFTIIKENEFYNILIDKIKKEKTILFCDKPIYLSEINDELIYLPDKIHNNFINRLELDFHKEWNVIKLLKKGVLTHHGLMPKYVQNKMLNAFNNDPSYNLLVGTNSISEGINTPTRNIFIHPKTDLTFNTLLLKNTIGRAGRLGIFPVGHIFSVQNLENQTKDDIVITLSASKDDEVSEILDTKDTTKIKALCEEFCIPEVAYYKIISTYRISLLKFRRLLEMLKKNKTYSSIEEILYMTASVFKEDYPFYQCKIDKPILNATLNYYYFKDKEKKNRIKLENFTDKINYYRFKDDDASSITDSEIIDLFMRFNYSSLDYYIYPVARMGDELHNLVPNFNFGEHVLNIIEKFLKKYHNKFLGVSNFELYSEEQKKILLTLREYGIPVSKELIGQEMVEEINQLLNVRYSTFDIIQAIKKLQYESQKNKNRFKLIVERYID